MRNCKYLEREFQDGLLQSLALGAALGCGAADSILTRRLQLIDMKAEQLRKIIEREINLRAATNDDPP